MRATFSQQLFGVVNDAVLTVHLMPPTALALLVCRWLHRARAIEHFQIFQRILLHDDQIGSKPSRTTPNSIGFALRLVQRERAVHRRRLDDFQRMEASFLQHSNSRM